ncbi:MAG: hypothetical protein QM765_23560 [Myxococcales bacterium]
MRTTINIDEALLELAKQQARARRVSLGQVVEDALRAALVARKAETVPPFELVTFRGDGPREGIDLDRTSELLAAEDEQRYRKG